MEEVEATKVRVFKLTYTNKAGEYVQTDAQSVEDQTNRSFGLSVEEAEDFGVKVEMMPEDFEMPEDRGFLAPVEVEQAVDSTGTDKTAPPPAITPPPVEDVAPAPAPAPPPPWAPAGS